MIHTCDRRKIIAEASDWCMLIESGKATDQDISDFVLWIDQSPLHQKEYDAVQSIWSDGSELGDIYQEDIDELLGVKSRASVTSDVLTFSVPLKNMRKVLVAVAAMLLVAFVFGGLAIWQNSQFWNLGEGDIVHHITKKGESKRVCIADGSCIHLNTQSAIEVRVNESERLIFLKEGEAFFEVAHDPSRPFIVRSNDTAVRALGTKFSVGKFSDEFSVTVTEGTVLVSRSLHEDVKTEDEMTDQINLDAGETIRIPQAVPLSDGIVEKVDVTKVLSWRNGKLLFEQKPLAEVVSDFNRYNERMIVIADPSLSGFLISGYFDAHDPDGFLKIVEKLISVRVVSVSENEIRLLKKKN